MVFWAFRVLMASTVQLEDGVEVAATVAEEEAAVVGMGGIEVAEPVPGAPKEPEIEKSLFGCSPLSSPKAIFGKIRWMGMA